VGGCVATGTEVGVSGGDAVGEGGRATSRAVAVGEVAGEAARVAGGTVGATVAPGFDRCRLTQKTANAMTMMSTPAPSAIHGNRLDGSASGGPGGGEGGGAATGWRSRHAVRVPRGPTVPIA